MLTHENAKLRDICVNADATLCFILRNSAMIVLTCIDARDPAAILDLPKRNVHQSNIPPCSGNSIYQANTSEPQQNIIGRNVDF